VVDMQFSMNKMAASAASAATAGVIRSRYLQNKTQQNKSVSDVGVSCEQLFIFVVFEYLCFVTVSRGKVFEVWVVLYCMSTRK
jgi:hypothetical protein